MPPWDPLSALANGHPGGSSNGAPGAACILGEAIFDLVASPDFFYARLRAAWPYVGYSDGFLFSPYSIVHVCERIWSKCSQRRRDGPCPGHTEGPVGSIK